MPEILISTPEPNKLLLTKNPEAYLLDLIKNIGASIVWIFFCCIPIVNGQMDLANNEFHVFFFCLTMLLPAGLITWGILRYLPVRNGFEYEFDRNLETICLNGVLIHTFKEVRHILFERVRDSEDGDTYAVYMVLKTGKKIKIETMHNLNYASTLVNNMVKFLGTGVKREHLQNYISIGDNPKKEWERSSLFNSPLLNDSQGFL